MKKGGRGKGSAASIKPKEEEKKKEEEEVKETKELTESSGKREGIK